MLAEYNNLQFASGCFSLEELMRKINPKKTYRVQKKAYLSQKQALDKYQKKSLTFLYPHDNIKNQGYFQSLKNK